MLSKKLKQFKPSSAYSKKGIVFFAAAFALIGVATLLLTRAATPGITVVVDSTLPNPTNIKTFGDDRVATVTWDAPSNAESRSIVGYYVTWGTQASGTFTSTKQTIFTIAQIQPMTNGTVYNVKVQSVQGSYHNEASPGWHHEQEGGDTYAVANGKVSTGVTATVTPSSARVDQLRTQMTGFFDDFNQPAGAFDELKWNTATSSCADYGESSAFLNNQFHSHNQVATPNPGIRDCDRGQIISRPRATFDISGRTEANPGVVVMDLDGVSQPRDFWYLDLIPLNARTTNAPLDITSHASADDDGFADPMMIRFEQKVDNGYVLQQGDLNISIGQTDKKTVHLDLTGCDARAMMDCAGAPKTAGLSPLAEPSYNPSPVPNVRRHWRFEISPTKLKVFIDSALVATTNMPSQFAGITKYTVHSNIFSYNTGKQFLAGYIDPTTSLLHWDNFGFNGPAPTTVIHNYQEGGSTGNTPFLGTGAALGPNNTFNGDQLPQSPRTTKIPIPDTIGSPISARLYYTVQSIGYKSWGWTNNEYFMLNGHRYNIPNPATTEKPPHYVIDGNPTTYAHAKIPYADSVAINPADLIQGVNNLQINFESAGQNIGDLLNVHLELEYPKASTPTYTQPINIFGASTFMRFNQPALRKADTYWFIEQDMGLPSGTTETTTPPPPPPPPPTPPPSPPGKVGDINGDGSVGIADLAILLGNYSQSVPINTKGDLNGSSTVTTADLAILLGNYGK